MSCIPNLPSPDAVFEGICGLLDVRFDRSIGKECDQEQTKLLKLYFEGLATSCGVRAEEYDAWGRPTNGPRRCGLRWMDGTSEVAAIAWDWRTEGDLTTFKNLLARKAPLKVFLMDSGTAKAELRAKGILDCLDKCIRSVGTFDLLAVVFVTGRKGLLARAVKIVPGRAERLIRKKPVRR